jgi:CRP/FNR family transcriptional regulator, polysaccharide utilization system transcription regulator
MTNSNLINSCTVNYDSFKCFEQLTDEELHKLEKNRLQVNYKKGEIICKQGTFASHVMYVCKGLVKIFVENDQGSLILKILPEGKIIGLTSLYEGNNVFQYSAQAYSDSVINLIDINIFRELIKTNAAFGSEVINVLCENAIQTYGRFFCFTNKQSYGRLADVILCLACRIFKKNDFELNLSRKELAELSGLSTERTIRILKKFKDENLIEITDKQFRILDYEKLQKISNHG